MLPFLYLVVFNNSFSNSVGNENVRVRLALSILTSVPITLANDAIEILPIVADKTMKDL